MKDWQHGYELDYLKDIEKDFEPYNKICLSPFAVMKKNRVAERLFKNQLVISGKSYILTSIANSSMPIKMCGDVVIGKKQKGERLIENPVGDKIILAGIIDGYTENCWLYINAEYKEGIELAELCGFIRVGTKINSFSDITFVYKRGDDSMIYNKDLGVDNINILKIGEMLPSIIQSLQKKLNGMDNLFANHYSKYNKGKSWSAVSIKGFHSNISMIEKPDEMNNKWHKENEDKEFNLQYTTLYDYFKDEIDSILAIFGDTEIERIRLMRLEPNEGELERHTDQTDKELGTSDGKIMRLHIPIITNDKVSFSSWDNNNIEIVKNMKEGELWYLDIRKPHRALNGGVTERIHLVIDVRANDAIREMLI